MTFGDFCSTIAGTYKKTLQLSDEGAKAREDVLKAMWKLADKTGLEWGLFTRQAYERDVIVGAAIGMMIGTISTAIAVNATIKKRLSRTPESEEES